MKETKKNLYSRVNKEIQKYKKEDNHYMRISLEEEIELLFKKLQPLSKKQTQKQTTYYKTKRLYVEEFLKGDK